MAKRNRVHTACRDCALCTGNQFTGFGRASGRNAADAASLGLTRLLRPYCKMCGHAMEEHNRVSLPSQPVYQDPAYDQPQEYPAQPYPPMPPSSEWAPYGEPAQQPMQPLPPAQPPMQPLPPAQPPVTHTLEQLADWHQRGLITGDEYAAAKARILGI